MNATENTPDDTNAVKRADIIVMAATGGIVVGTNTGGFGTRQPSWADVRERVGDRLTDREFADTVRSLTQRGAITPEGTGESARLTRHLSKMHSERHKSGRWIRA